ncbi:unnamed protein product [Caenorhabditis auriculariae]|uniref:N-acetylgalactosaminide beta-1,3-galactosyltransferase n=1 Tax=Caenorhabditis auriculariae TaxID=2777116 RepID=A0A8S1HFV4_9PELO|nr:unnamed protein product [Caenorhabditis auriculariae]
MKDISRRGSVSSTERKQEAGSSAEDWSVVRKKLGESVRKQYLLLDTEVRQFRKGSLPWRYRWAASPKGYLGVDRKAAIEETTVRLPAMNFVRRFSSLLLLLCTFALLIVFVLPFFLQFEGLVFAKSVLDSFSGIRGSVDEVRDVDKWVRGVTSTPTAQGLPKSGKLFCFVETSSKYYDTRVPAVWATWLPRCEHGQFFTPTPLSNSKIPHSTVYANLKDTYEDLFNKSILSFFYAFTKISDKFDWYLKADDDTYIIVEHLYEYLETLDPKKPYYLGYVLKPYFRRGYNGGGAGYILSREAVRRFIEGAFHNTTTCPWDKFEDTGMARCLESVGITPHDTRDANGRSRFNTFRADEMFQGTIGAEWHFYKPILGRNWASPQLISLHHMSSNDMLLYDDLLYRIRPPVISSKHVIPETEKNS